MNATPPPPSADPWPPKAYKNDAFLNSPEARKIRVLCEMTEPEIRFARENIQDTIVFFGSARSVDLKAAEEHFQSVKAQIGNKTDLSPEEAVALRKARALLKLAPYYQAAVELSEAMTRWTMSLEDKTRRFIVCTGGGPGMMEAANRGAHNAGSPTIGLGISLPFEQELNQYVTPDLQFEFHYFFIRKYWLAYWAKALVVFPGGFGTMDELFELLTLEQTRKITKQMPIVLYGREFWEDILNFEAFVDWGVISPQDLSLFRICDSVEEARDYLIEEFTRLYLTPPKVDA